MDLNEGQKEEVAILSQSLNEDKKSFKAKKLLFVFLGIILLGAFIFGLAKANEIKLVGKIADIGGQFFYNSGEFKLVDRVSLEEKSDLKNGQNDLQEKLSEKKSKKKTSGVSKNKKSNNNSSAEKDKNNKDDLEKTANAKKGISLILNNNSTSGVASQETLKKYFTLTVSKLGNGNGNVLSDKWGIDCGNKCSNDYLQGTKISLIAAYANDSYFGGWGGACNGDKDCSVVLNNNIYISADFGLNSANSSQIVLRDNQNINSTQNNNSGENNGGSNSNNSAVIGINHLVVSEIFVGMDGNANYEFIELYNPTNQEIDLTGWTIKKRSSSGAESSLVVSSRLDGNKMLAGKYFLIVNEGGYNGTVSSDAVWAKSNTLAYTNNTIIIYNGNGEEIEQVSWIEIPKNESFERVSWDSSQFKIEANPNPQNSHNN